MKRLLCSIFFLASIHVHAQVNLDSLWKIWNDPSAPDTVRMDAMGTIAFDGYLNSNPDTAFFFAQKQLNLAIEKGNKKFQAQALSTQGCSFYFKGEYVKAVDYNTKSLRIREAIGDRLGEASSLNNIGSVYLDQGQQEKGISYFTRSLLIREQIGDKTGVAASYNNIGAIYAQKGLYAVANEYYQRSLKLREELNDKAGIATSLNNIGRLYSYEDQLEKAREYYDRALKIREEIGDKKGIAFCLYNIGNIYEDQDDYKTAVEYHLRSLKIAQEAQLVLDMEFAGEELADCYKKLGKYKEALEMHELFITMRDSTRSLASQKELVKQEMQYNYDKQKALNEKEHEKQLAVAGEHEKKQKAISYSVASGLLLVILFAFFVSNRLRVTKKQKGIIEHQKQIVEEKQKEVLDSISYAKRLQDAILPSDELLKKTFPDSFIFYKPKDIVAGDFYWLEEKNNKIYLAAADCTGHGVPGAMVSVVCSNALNRSLLEFGITDPGRILDKTKILVTETFAKSDKNVSDGMDISLCCIDKISNEILWAGANNPLWYSSNNRLEAISPDKQPIGRSLTTKPFTTHTIKLQKGDCVYLFSDGFADQFGGPRGKKFKYKPLMEILSNYSELPLLQQKEKLEEAFANWKGALEQVDDVCVLGVRIA